MKFNLFTVTLMSVLSLASTIVKASDDCSVWINSSIRTQNFPEFDEQAIKDKIIKALDKKGYSLVQKAEAHLVSYELVALADRKNGSVSMKVSYANSNATMRMNFSSYKTARKAKKQIKAMQQAIDESMSMIPSCR